MRDMSHLQNRQTKLIIGIISTFAIGFGALSLWSTYTLHATRAERDQLTLQNDSSAANLDLASSSIAELTDQISMLTIDLEDMTADYEREKQKNDDFEAEYRDIINTVYDLDKLSKTDKELLQKYSKVYFLNENYIPSKLSDIPEEYILAGHAPQEFHSSALSFLEDMLDAAAEDGVDLKVVSAYRSFDTQAQLKGTYLQTYGTGANTFSADQGYSEHQLGTAIDLSDPATGGPYDAFGDTEAYQWLLRHAYRYGFVLSYPEDNEYYVYEPWHWRFVGRDLSRALHRADANFYDWDQRQIDDYLLSIFD